MKYFPSQFPDLISTIDMKCFLKSRCYKFSYPKHLYIWNSLSVQWLGLHAPTAGGMGSIPGQGTKILQAVQHGQKNKN